MALFDGFFNTLPGLDVSPAVIVSYSAGSCIGSRAHNQDNLRAGRRLPYIRARRQLSRKGVLELRDVDIFCVCDGIGGGYRGDLAAKYALKAIKRYLKSEFSPLTPLREILLSVAEHAHREVCGFYRTVQSIGGCTLVMTAIRGDEYAFLNIGDSPGFLIPANGPIWELSCRHNMAWDRLRRDLPAECGDSNHLLRYLGMADTTAEEMAFTAEGYLEEGDRILLCTDGVTNSFPPQSLERAVHTGLTAGEITAAAGQAVGADNCTAVCLTILELLTGPCPTPTRDAPVQPEPAPEKERTGGDEDDTATEGAAGTGDHPV